MTIGTFLFWLVQTCVMVFMLCDVAHLPFMEMFDTTIELNGLFWIITIVVMYVNWAILIELKDKDE